MDEEQFGRSLEELACQVPQGTFLRGRLLDGGEISMATALRRAGHISLAFERPQDGQHGGVGQFVSECRANFRDKGRPALPKHLHDVDFPIRELDVNPTVPTRTIVDNTAFRAGVNYEYSSRFKEACSPWQGRCP